MSTNGFYYLYFYTIIVFKYISFLNAVSSSLNNEIHNSYSKSIMGVVSFIHM